MVVVNASVPRFFISFLFVIVTTILSRDLHAERAQCGPLLRLTLKIARDNGSLKKISAALLRDLQNRDIKSVVEVAVIVDTFRPLLHRGNAPAIDYILSEMRELPKPICT